MASPMPSSPQAFWCPLIKENELEEYEADLTPTVSRDVVLYLAVSSLPCGDTKLHVESHVM